MPGLARVAASAALHTTEWSVKTSAKGWLRVGRAITRPDEAAAMARDATRAVNVIGELARSVSSGVPVSRALMTAGEALGGLVENPEIVNGTVVEQAASRRRCATAAPSCCTARATCGTPTRGTRPSTGSSTSSRPTRAGSCCCCSRAGPSPASTCAPAGRSGMVSSQLIAPGLTMIGARAGCRYLDQVPAYLNNLFRLGLVWFSRESLRDPLSYQVVEAQPDVLEAMHSVRFAKVVRRSIHLTPFGEDFCRSVPGRGRGRRDRCVPRALARRRSPRRRSPRRSPDGAATQRTTGSDNTWDLPDATVTGVTTSPPR